MESKDKLQTGDNISGSTSNRELVSVTHKELLHTMKKRNKSAGKWTKHTNMMHLYFCCKQPMHLGKSAQPRQ